MKNDNIRLLAFKDPELVKSLIVTQNQVKIIRLISRRPEGVFSTLLVKKLNISIQSASSILSKIYRKGYLTREEKIHPTGGSQYLYNVRPEFVPF